MAAFDFEFFPQNEYEFGYGYFDDFPCGGKRVTEELLEKEYGKPSYLSCLDDHSQSYFFPNEIGWTWNRDTIVSRISKMTDIPKSISKKESEEGEERENKRQRKN